MEIQYKVSLLRGLWQVPEEHLSCCHHPEICASVPPVPCIAAWHKQMLLLALNEAQQLLHPVAGLLICCVTLSEAVSLLL